MIIPDANLLIYAYNTSSPFHVKAKSWLEDLLSGADPVGLTYPVVFSFLRITTSSRIFSNPLTLTQAHEILGTWQEQSVTTMLTPYPEYLQDVYQLLHTAGSSGGNLVTDARIAALALHYGGCVHTADTDFIRFAKLRVKFPLSRK